MRGCALCPRACGADRAAGETGLCGSPSVMRIARAALHHWEEPVISGKNGSGAVFFTGCGLRCVYCQNDVISSDAMRGKAVTPQELSGIFTRLENEGAHNINLVTAAQYVPLILEALSFRRPSVPVVYNSSGYESLDTLRRLDGFVDIYLPDYKYAIPETAARYSGAPDYPETALLAIKEMKRQCGEPVLEGGLMKRGLLIRHLVLPLNVKNTVAVLQSIKRHFPGVPVSLMAQYIPAGKAHAYPELNRRITRREFDRVADEMIRLGLDGFVQSRDAADEGYIPEFL